MFSDMRALEAPSMNAACVFPQLDARGHSSY